MKKLIDLIKQNALIYTFLYLPLIIWAGVYIHRLLNESEYTEAGRVYIEEQKINEEERQNKLDEFKAQWEKEIRITKNMQNLFNEWKSEGLQSLSTMEGISIDSLKSIYVEGIIMDNYDVILQDGCEDYMQDKYDTQYYGDEY